MLGRTGVFASESRCLRSRRGRPQSTIDLGARRRSYRRRLGSPGTVLSGSIEQYAHCWCSGYYWARSTYLRVLDLRALPVAETRQQQPSCRSPQMQIQEKVRLPTTFRMMCKLRKIDKALALIRIFFNLERTCACFHDPSSQSLSLD